jgi:formylglycine-generating enzyme required for sulfatase activity
MNLFRLSLFSFFILLQNLLTAKEPIRTWTSSDGRTLEARFIEQVGSNVRIKNEAGREFTLPIIRFSKTDQDYVVEAVSRALFQSPEAFEDRGKGAIIIASVTGKVTVIPAPRYSGSQEVKPVARNVIVGEPLPHGSTIITGVNSEADLLLTTGSLAKIGPNSKLVLNAFWQKDFRASAKKVTDLKEETSPSRVAFKLETGDLVVDVKKLNRESSFMIESPVGVAGIRGTQFGLSANSDSTELAVLEGRVGFLDANQKAKSVETAQKVSGSQNGAGEVDALADSEKSDLAKAVADSQESASEYDLTRLANTVEGFAPKPNYIVKSALNMELIWCQPGSFIMGPGDGRQAPAHPVTLTHGFYLGKYEVTQTQYQRVMNGNPAGLNAAPSLFKGSNRPVETVHWNDAVAFCEALTKKGRVPNGWKFSLPSEAQWEYACRAGTKTKFSWGNDITPKLANYKDSALEKTAEVGSYAPNPWGFFDMHGNVSEFCTDYFDAYPSGSVTDPTGPVSGSSRVLRGGGWSTPIRHSAARDAGKENFRGNNRGFRISFQKQ